MATPPLESQRFLPGLFQIIKIGPDDPFTSRACNSQTPLFTGLTDLGEREMLPNALSECGLVRRRHLHDKARCRLTEEDDLLCFIGRSWPAAGEVGADTSGQRHLCHSRRQTAFAHVMAGTDKSALDGLVQSLEDLRGEL